MDSDGYTRYEMDKFQILVNVRATKLRNFSCWKYTFYNIKPSCNWQCYLPQKKKIAKVVWA